MDEDDSSDNQSIGSFENQHVPPTSRYKAGRFLVTLFPKKTERFVSGRFRITSFRITRSGAPKPEVGVNVEAHTARSNSPPLAAPAFRRSSIAPSSPSRSDASPAKSRNALRSLLCCTCTPSKSFELELDHDFDSDPLTPPSSPLSLSPPLLHLNVTALLPTSPHAPDPTPGISPLPAHPPHTPGSPNLNSRSHPHSHHTRTKPKPAPYHPNPPPPDALDHHHPPHLHIRSQAHLRSKSKSSITSQHSEGLQGLTEESTPSSYPSLSPHTSHDALDTLHRHSSHSQFRTSAPGYGSSFGFRSDSEPLLVPSSPTDSASSLTHRRLSGSQSLSDVSSLSRVETKGRFRVHTCLTTRPSPPPALDRRTSQTDPPEPQGAGSLSPAPTPLAQKKGRFTVYQDG